jgi:hypothetical protein
MTVVKLGLCHSKGKDRLRVLEKGVLMEIFGCQKEEIIGA